MSPLLVNWKTTAVGTIVLVIALLQAIHFDSAGHLAMTQRDWFLAAIGVLGQIVGALQKDAGVTLAKVPGKAEPSVEPSTEVPINPAAIPVEQEKTK